MDERPKLIKGGTYTDPRGALFFNNDFQLDDVKRFYIIEHSNPEIVRAWQGHRYENKWFYVIKGAFLVAFVKPDDWENPSKGLEVQTFSLSAEKNEVLYLPGGYANGFKAIEADSKILIFSNFDLKQSENDSFKFSDDLWYDWR